MTNANATPALMDMLMNTVGEQRLSTTGEPVTISDNDLVKYRLFSIPSDNFSAFLLDVHLLIGAARAHSKHLTPVMADAITREVADLARTYIVSVTGKSAEDSKLLHMLLNDETKSYHFFKDFKKPGMMDKFMNSQGNSQALQPRQVDDGY